MLQGRRVLAMIPARGGSKGIPNKNIITLAGKPLITHTIEAAKKSAYIDRIIVSTDAEAIAQVAKQAGADVPFLRPQELASDTAKSIDAVLHCLSYVRQSEKLTAHGETPYEIFVLLQPTSPLRTEQDIDGALETFLRQGEHGLASVCLMEESPVLARTIDEEGMLRPLLEGSSTVRRQELPKYYHVNGAIYINSTDEICEETSFNDNPVAYVMDQSHSIDIDEPEDLALAEYLITRQPLTEGK